eukprot:TRINITY_DN4372_c0_g1_i4.p1 TRINITY_DN4372_c0_g1~~TRINITY_DN4372_c0_g1_i4.p1  ORF type:complete len:481 (+),score=42.38 TRINITY_DN4372_c0_g1_i4:98-1540(+)
MAENEPPAPIFPPKEPTINDDEENARAKIRENQSSFPAVKGKMRISEESSSENTENSETSSKNSENSSKNSENSSKNSENSSKNTENSSKNSENSSKNSENSSKNTENSENSSENSQFITEIPENPAEISVQNAENRSENAENRSENAENGTFESDFTYERALRPAELKRTRKGVLFAPDQGGTAPEKARKPVAPATHFFSAENGANGADEGVEERVIAKAEKQKRGYLMWTISAIQLISLVFIVLNDGMAPICISGGNCNPFIGPKPEALRTWGAKDAYLIRENGEFWRFLTPVFLHAGFVHLLSNLLFQLRAGADMECLWGWWRVLAIYTVSGIGGNVVSAVVAPSVLSVGASGSLFGLLGSLYSELLMNWRFMPAPGRQLLSLLAMTAVVVAVGMLPMIDQFVHLGGLIFGFLIGFLFVPKTKARLVPYILRFIGTGLAIAGLLTALTIFYNNPSYKCSVCRFLNPWGDENTENTPN